MRLSSWKEIASYFHASVATVQRWEKLESLPVHRHLHNKLGSAYAFTAELDAWHARRGGANLPEFIPRSEPPKRPMIAVLPLQNLSGDPSQDYFAEGLTEEIITEMGHLYADRVGVIARTSVMHYKSRRASVNRIGRELGVGYILEGSFRRSDSRVRVAVQLVEVLGQTHLWAQAYEVPVADIFVVQAQIAQAVAEKVGIHLCPAPAARRLLDPEAYECCLKGRFQWYKLSRDHFDLALSYYQAATEKDPECALAHAGIADVWWIRGDNGLIPAAEAHPRTLAALSKALALDDSSSDVHVTMANCKFAYEWDWRSAESEFRRAIHLNPNSAHAHFMYSDFLVSLSRFDEAEHEMNQALLLDAFNPFFRCFLGWHLLYRRQDHDAIVQLRRALRAGPRLSAAHLGIWGAFRRAGKTSKALAACKSFFESLGDTEVVGLLAREEGSRNYERTMRKVAQRLAARSSRTYVPGIRIARLFAQAEASSDALCWLERAYENREPPLVHLKVGWDWDSLRKESRFQRILVDMNLL